MSTSVLTLAFPPSRRGLLCLGLGQYAAGADRGQTMSGTGIHLHLASLGHPRLAKPTGKDVPLTADHYVPYIARNGALAKARVPPQLALRPVVHMRTYVPSTWLAPFAPSMRRRDVGRPPCMLSGTTANVQTCSFAQRGLAVYTGA